MKGNWQIRGHGAQGLEDRLLACTSGYGHVGFTEVISGFDGHTQGKTVHPPRDGGLGRTIVGQDD